MRGNLYEISDNLDEHPIGQLCEENLYDEIGTEFSYVEKAIMEQSDIRKSFAQYGIMVRSEKNEDGESLSYFMVSEDLKKDYFKDRFEKLKETVEKMTLSDFIASTYDMQQLIEQTDGDAVYFNYFQTFDHFMRNSEPDKKYYIGNVCFMH